jgi:hypothetical protein
VAEQDIRLPKTRKLDKPSTLRSGMRTDVTGKPIKNVILLSLPDREFNLLRPYLEYVDLPHHRILHEVGTPLAVGLDRGPYRAIMQISGDGLRVKSDVLTETLLSAPELRVILSRYVLIQGLQVAQIAACNRLHEIEQRLARWLLMCQDRVDSDLLPVTHEFLAQMLGTGRPSVSLAAGVLQRAGTIENVRGSVKILNRKDLEDAACECYRALQHFHEGMGLR